jgi:hypothetical protein
MQFLLFSINKIEEKATHKLFFTYSKRNENFTNSVKSYRPQKKTLKNYVRALAPVVLWRRLFTALGLTKVNKHKK